MPSLVFAALAVFLGGICIVTNNPSCACGSFFILSALAIFFVNRTSILINREKISSQTQPIPLNHSQKLKEFAVKDIQEIFIQPHTDKTGYGIFVLLHNKKHPQTLIRYIKSYQYVNYVQKVISAELAIPIELKPVVLSAKEDPVIYDSRPSSSKTKTLASQPQNANYLQKVISKDLDTPIELKKEDFETKNAATIYDSPPSPNKIKTIASQPNKMTVNRSAEGLVISWRWFGRQTIFMIFFAGFWNVVAWSIGASILKNGEFNLFFLLIPGLHLILGIWLIYTVLRGLFNKTTITINEQHISVQTKPLPSHGAYKEFYTAKIKRIHVYRNTHESDEGGTSYTYDIFLTTTTHSSERLLHPLDNRDEALFLAQTINRYLNLSTKSEETLNA